MCDNPDTPIEQRVKHDCYDTISWFSAHPKKDEQPDVHHHIAGKMDMDACLVFRLFSLLPYSLLSLLQ